LPEPQNGALTSGGAHEILGMPRVDQLDLRGRTLPIKFAFDQL
jgi:hypothetical protein